MNSVLHKPSATLWLALRFPAFALNALDIIEWADDQSIIVTEKQYVVYANAQARRDGIGLGMDITTAKLLSNCQEHQRNSSAEEKSLKQLMDGAYQFTPYIEICQPQGLMQRGLLLEISGCLALFSGLANLVKQVETFLQKKRYQFSLGLGHSAQAAWLLSFTDKNACLLDVEPDKNFFINQLAELPIQLLHDYPKAIDALEKTGFTNLGDIIRQIEAGSLKSFKRRFGDDFVCYLKDLFDIDQDFQQGALFAKPLEIYQPDDLFNELFELEYPTSNSAFLIWPMETLLRQLSNYLRKRQLETQQIEWTLSDIYGGKDVMIVNSDSPQSHWQLLYDLSLIQLENRILNFEVDKLRLCCRHTNSLQARNFLLVFDQARKNSGRTQSFALSAAKLKARLGEAAIYKLSYSDSFWPEECNQKIPLGEACQQDLPHVHKTGLRPNWLLPEPVPVEMRAKGLYWRGYLELIAGPERICNGWWEAPRARDYFVAKRNDHLRVWIYRDLYDKQWYLQGIFG